MYDLVVRGGTVVDGTGSAPFTGDVAVSDGIIVDVGHLDGPSRRTIHADGALVTPGWIDAHTHYDGQVTWDDRLEGSAANGVTTIVMGNCGVGFAPVRPGAELDLIDLMEGVENIPGTALYEGLPWGKWQSFPEYLDFLGTREWTVDVGTQIAHSALRFYVMGARALKGADATEVDVASMATLVEQAARAGALGFSTSRIQFHRSLSGHTIPGTFAPEEELQALAFALRVGGGATFQGIPSQGAGEMPALGPEQATISQDVEMFARISRQSGLNVTFTTQQISTDPDAWREVLRISESENASGAHLYPMVCPRGTTVLTTLEGYHVFMRRPTYLALAHLPLGELVRELRRPEVKAAILAESDRPAAQLGAMENTLIPSLTNGLGRTFPMGDPVDYEPSPDDSLAARAAAQGREPLEYLYDFLVEDGGRTVGMQISVNYAAGNLDVCREMLSSPSSVAGLSDAGAHVMFISDMSTPTFLVAHWAHARTRGEHLAIELCVAKTTSVAATVFGLTDRGVLAPGKRADMNVIDLENLKSDRPTVSRDLPAGGSRLLQPARGYIATFNHGVQTRDHDEDTGARPGRLVRRAAACGQLTHVSASREAERQALGRDPIAAHMAKAESRVSS